METKLRREGSGSEGPSVPSAQPGPLPSPCWADGGRRGAAPQRTECRPGPGTEGRGLSVAILTFGLLVLFRGLEERGLLLLGQEPKPGQGGGRLATCRGSSGVWVLASACRPRGAWGTRGPRRRVPTSPSGSFTSRAITASPLTEQKPEWALPDQAGPSFVLFFLSSKAEFPSRVVLSKS